MIKNEDDDEGNRTKDSFVWRKDNLFKWNEMIFLFSFFELKERNSWFEIWSKADSKQ